MNEYGKLLRVAIRRSKDAFLSQEKVDAEWQKLRFHQAPLTSEANAEYEVFEGQLRQSGAELIGLPESNDLTLDAIYTRDALIVSPKGLILATWAGQLGKESRHSMLKL